MPLGRPPNKRLTLKIGLWETLYALEDGPLPLSTITLVGAHVEYRRAKALEVRGLATITRRERHKPGPQGGSEGRVIVDEVAELTAAGRRRIKVGF